MPGPKLAAQFARNFRHVDTRGGLGTIGIHLGNVGREHQIAASTAQHVGIAIRGARVVRKIFVRPELHWIDKDTRHEALAVAARGVDQTDVTRVQIAHRRHKHHALASAAPGADGRAHSSNAMHRLHQENPCSVPG